MANHYFKLSRALINLPGLKEQNFKDMYVGLGVTSKLNLCKKVPERGDAKVKWATSEFIPVLTLDSLVRDTDVRNAVHLQW